MYGLVNKAVKDLVIANAGEEIWLEIASEAGVDPIFISMDSYDDKVTYDLVAVASRRLETPAEEILRQFGSHWIRFTATEGYGPLVEMFGGTLAEFLRNLSDDLHGRVAVTMPHLKPPEFFTEEVSPNQFDVHYKSHRPGLSPMVQGLLEGLAERYKTRADVAHKDTVSEQPVHEVFSVKII